MSTDPDQGDLPRWTAGLRRHGLVRRPADLRRALGSRELRFTEGNSVELYDCGRTAFPAMLDAIEEADDFVHLETYLFRTDQVGTRFVEALADRASDGVEVRLLYDAIGSRHLAPSALEPLRRAGAEITVFNPLRRIYPEWAPRRRDHRKLLIVDGRVAFTGGLNIGDEYDATAVLDREGPGWRDTHAAVRGAAVRDLSAVFLESWFRAGGPELPWHSLLHVEPTRIGNVRCAVVPDGPTYRRRAMRDLLVSALDAVAETARLTSPYFAPDGHVLEALERAAERGARVELILTSQTDHPLLRHGARSTVERMVKRGIHVYEYGSAMLHAKTAVFDSNLGIVGTSNLDRQSFQHNFEVNLVTQGLPVSKELNRLFDLDLGRSVEVTLDQLSRRGPLSRAVDRVAAWIVKRFL